MLAGQQGAGLHAVSSDGYELPADRTTCIDEVKVGRGTIPLGGVASSVRFMSTVEGVDTARGRSSRGELGTHMGQVRKRARRPKTPRTSANGAKPHAYAEARATPASMTLDVVSDDDGHTVCSFLVRPTWSMRDVRATIARRLGIAPIEQRLLVGGQLLPAGDRQTLRDVGLFRKAVAQIHVRLQRRTDLVRAAVLPELARGGGSLLELQAELREDREVVLAAVEGNGLELRHASDKLRDDFHVVSVAVRTSGYALQYASQRLQGNRKVVMAAVATRGLALRFAHAELTSDREIVLAAINSDAGALAHAARSLRGDPEIVRAAVAREGYDAFFDEMPHIAPVALGSDQEHLLESKSAITHPPIGVDCDQSDDNGSGCELESLLAEVAYMEAKVARLEASLRPST